MVVGVELQEQKRNDDGTVDANTWVKNFTIEQSKPMVQISTPSDGQSISSMSKYDGTRTVTVSGAVRELASEITGVEPSLAINGQAVPLAGSAGHFTFSGPVTVQRDGLISAICTDGYGNQGADEVIISRISTAPADAVPPATRPTDPTVLDGPNGFVFSRNLYGLTATAEGYTLTVRNRITGTQAAVPVMAAGTITEPDGDAGTVSVPVFASADGAWLVEIRSTAAGTATQRGTMAVTVRVFGRDESQLLIETAPGSGVFIGQQAEVAWSSPVAPSATVADTITATIYKPFAPPITATLTETAVDSGIFSGAAGVSVTLGTAAGFVSPVASVTAPALGLDAAPVVTPETGTGVANFAAAPLVQESPTPQAGGYGSTDSYREEYAALPLADALPQPRAKRIVMHLPNATAATKTMSVTTDQGTTHAVVLTKVGDEYRSEQLFYEPKATGSRALGGFPVKYETTEGGPNDPPVTLAEDVGGDVEVDITTAAGEKLRRVVVRRLPGSSDEPGSHTVNENTILTGGARLRLVSGVFGGLANRGNARLYAIRIDTNQWEYLNIEAESALARNEAVEATLALEAEERAAVRAAMAQYRGNSDGGWRWIGPRSFLDLQGFSAGFAAGVGQQVNETVNPWEIMKGLLELAEFAATANFSEIDGGEAFKRVIFGHFEDLQQAALRGDMRAAGKSAGQALIFFVTIPVGAEALPAAAAKFKKVCTGLKITILPANSSVLLRSTFLGVEALIRFEQRIKYAVYDATLGRVTGRARAWVNQGLIDAKLGERARADLLEFPGVDEARFTTRELERGHLIAKQFGGKGRANNIVPLFYKVNQRLHRQIERDVADLAAEGKEIEYVVEAIYGDHPSIPKQIKVTAKVDGVKVIDEIIDNVP